MHLKDFSYSLPPELIAQYPHASRDQSRMLLTERKEKRFSDLSFSSFPDFLNKGDVLVINNSRVIPARLFGRKTTGGIVEILLLSQKKSGKENQRWEVLVRPGKRLRENDVIELKNRGEARILERISEKNGWLTFSFPTVLTIIWIALEKRLCPLTSNGVKIPLTKQRTGNDIRLFTRKTRIGRRTNRRPTFYRRNSGIFESQRCSHC